MKRVIYIVTIVIYLSACKNEGTKGKEEEKLYISIENYKIPEGRDFFDTLNTVELQCNSNLLEGTSVIVNKGMRLNTTSESMISDARTQDTLVISDRCFKIYFPSKYAAGGYLSFLVLNLKHKEGVEIAEETSKVGFFEFSVVYKRVKNENGVDIPELPVRLLIKKENSEE